MTSTVLLIAYIVIFVLQMVLLVLSVRRKTTKLWISLFLSEVIPMSAAYILMQYFDTLPKYGIMPGLLYFGEILFSLGAAVLYAAVLFVSLCVFIVVKMLEKRNSHRVNS